MRSADTDPEAEQVQLRLLREATVAARVSLARALTTTTMQLAHRALWQAHPNDTADEHAVRFVTHVYGRELGEELRRDLEARHQQSS
jgi:hypothetical protein